jgi:hypothetical protein
VSISDSLPADVADTGLARSGPVDLNEAARQLQLAIHDARVSFDCIGLDAMDRAHTSAITARAALDAAENLLRAALASNDVIGPDLDLLAEN